MDAFGFDEHAEKKRKVDSLGGDSAFTSESEVKKIVQTMAYDQLSNLMVQICTRNADAFQLLHEAWSRDVNNRKLYIRNLNFETSTETLNAVFAPYGVIVDCAVIKDKASGKNKGFGFVTFATAEEAQRAISNPPPSIDGRPASVALAAAGKPVPGSSVPSQAANLAFTSNDIAARKLFVRQLSFESTELSVRTFFQQWGDLQEVFIFRDKDTGKSKGHAFVTFVEAEAAAKAIQDPVKLIDGRKAIAKLAVEGQADNNKRQQQQFIQSANTLAAALASQNTSLSMNPYASLLSQGSLGGAGLGGASSGAPSSSSHQQLTSQLQNSLGQYGAGAGNPFGGAPNAQSSQASQAAALAAYGYLYGGAR